MSVLRDIEFRSCAAEAYGKNWQWRLAVARGYNLRTVQTWAAKPTERVPEEAYSHVHSMRSIIRYENVGHIIEETVRQLQRLGLNDHVIAAQLQRAADKLSPPDATPQGAPKPKNRSVPEAG